MLVKQLKNRYNDQAVNRKFVLGINRGKMKLFDVASTEQEALIVSGQPSAQSTYSRDDLDSKFKSGDKFSDWN